MLVELRSRARLGRVCARCAASPCLVTVVVMVVAMVAFVAEAAIVVAVVDVAAPSFFWFACAHLRTHVSMKTAEL